MSETKQRLRLPLRDDFEIANEVRRVYRAARLGTIPPADAANLAAILGTLANLV